MSARFYGQPSASPATRHPHEYARWAGEGFLFSPLALPFVLLPLTAALLLLFPPAAHAARARAKGGASHAVSAAAGRSSSKKVRPAARASASRGAVRSHASAGARVRGGSHATALRESTRASSRKSHRTNAHTATLERTARHAEAAPRAEAAASRSSAASQQQQVMDRVHAWYREHGVTEAATRPASAPAPQRESPALRAQTSAENSADDDGAAIPAETAATRRPARTATANPDSTPAATPRSEPAEDSSGEASHIPSTAPTERVPTPYRFGNSRVPARQGQSAPQPLPTGPMSSKPSLSLAAPALPANRRTPAISTVKAAAARQAQLDPETADELAADAFRNGSDAEENDGSGAEDRSSSAAGLKAPAAAGVRAATAAAVPVVPQLDASAMATLGSPAVPQPRLYDDAGRLLNIPPMRGSREILVHQNTMAESAGLSRIADDGDLLRMRRAGLLTPLPDTAAIGPDDRLPANRRYARPWTVRFLEDMGRAHYKRFGTGLTVTSAVRTVAFQRRLVRVNGNAAPPTGQVASPHLYGQAVDLGKHGMSVAEIAWMRAYLTPLMSSGRIDVEEEFQQSCFHISVYRGYLGTGKRAPATPAVSTPRMEQVRTAAPHRRLPTALLATQLP